MLILSGLRQLFFFLNIFSISGSDSETENFGHMSPLAAPMKMKISLSYRNKCNILWPSVISIEPLTDFWNTGEFQPFLFEIFYFVEAWTWNDFFPLAILAHKKKYFICFDKFSREGSLDLKVIFAPGICVVEWECIR